MTQQAARTGVGPTVFVAVEQHFPEGVRIIHDNMAYHILPSGVKAYVWATRFPPVRDLMIKTAEKNVPGIWSGMMCRKRYIDDMVTKAVANEVQAIVNLGAGFDTRAFRLPALANVPIWEVDQPENIATKAAGLRKVFGTIPPHIILVPIDFDHQKLGTILAAHGYVTSAKTFFIWEAVTQYLTEAGVQATFDFLASVPAGSRLAFTYVPKDFIDGKVLYGQETIYQQMLVKNKIWHFGLDPENIVNFLNKQGWRLVEDLGYGELAERYVKPTGRKLDFMAIERMVYAEKV